MPVNHWFTSDWHLQVLGHKNILKYDNRPWNTVEEMNEGLLKNFNSLVKDNDIVYYLGDFAFNFEQGVDILNRVKGRWIFILGNHDKGLSRILRAAERDIVIVEKMTEIKINDQDITLCHYPMISWNKSHYGSWQLFGHHHVKTFEEIPGRRLNVAVPLHDYKPWSYDEVESYMHDREIDLER